MSERPTTLDAAHAAPPTLKVAYGADRLVFFAFTLAPEDGAARLTEAERDVALLVIEGHSNAEVAALRGTSVRTVANQVASLLRKLGVSNRAELVARLPVVVASTSPR